MRCCALLCVAVRCCALLCIVVHRCALFAAGSVVLLPFHALHCCVKCRALWFSYLVYCCTLCRIIARSCCSKCCTSSRSSCRCACASIRIRMNGRTCALMHARMRAWGAHTLAHARTHAGIRVLATGQADVFVRTGQADVFAYEYVGYALSRLEGEIPSEDGCVPCRAAPRHAVPCLRVRACACVHACMHACMRACTCISS